MVCSRCGLIRPEKFGRCACCGYPVHATVAQLAEHRTCNAGVAGSTPARGSNAPAEADPSLLDRKLWCWWWSDVPRYPRG